MQIYGIHFTDTPKPQQPMLCASATLQNKTLTIDSFVAFYSFKEFEHFLKTPGAWVAGMDFPFGLPQTFVKAANLGNSWGEYVQRVAQLSPSAFAQLVDDYGAARKWQYRATDHAFSPMLLQLAGRRFQAGAPRLLASGVHIPVLQPNAASQVALEIYPALVLQKAARPTILSHLPTIAQQHYGLTLKFHQPIAEQPIHDPTGATLEAVLAAIQAAWGSLQPRYGLPLMVNKLEGWIVDPSTAHAR